LRSSRDRHQLQRVPTVDAFNPSSRWIPTPTIDGRHPLPQPARHRLPICCR
jgi:hypothetical protein